MPFNPAVVRQGVVPVPLDTGIAAFVEGVDVNGFVNIRLTDIAVLPEYRRHGIGTYLIEQLQNEAASAGKPLDLRVDKTNIAAKRFYEKLGFTVTTENQILYEMKWRSEQNV